jgi:heme-degrading monooxygenase HmoA
VFLQIVNGKEADFEAAFRQAFPIAAAARGYLGLELQRCMETPGKYLLLVRWETVEDHTVGFRQSREYQEWRQFLHHFYDPFPTVEHFEAVEL